MSHSVLSPQGCESIESLEYVFNSCSTILEIINILWNYYEFKETSIFLQLLMPII